MFIDTILDALIDTAKIVPVLLLLYILISFFSHRSKKSFNLITKKGKRFGPLIGSALGSIPQCGFSAVMADLYSKRAITLGTLFAIFLATSDEAIPILISEPAFYKEMLLIIGIKILIGILFGYLIDLILPQKNQLQPAKVKPKNETKIDAKIETKNEEIHEIIHTDCCCCGNHHEENEKDEHEKDEHGHEHCHSKKEHKHHCCADNIFLDALIHTARITLYILIFNLAFGTLIYFVGEDAFINFISINPYLQPFATSLIGLIPNCAASVLITETYMAGAITLPATIAGLAGGSGIGLLVLFKQNKNIKQNLLILLGLYLISVVVGVALTPFL